jgi:dTDP-4-amino-4,6-dideoxygalactose transaminase
MLVHSCTAALEMAAILADVGPGDEVIVPSFTFVSTANAFVLRGATPVFVDIRPDTLNLDERRVESAITTRTKAIVPVHYGGVGCEMPTIVEIAQQRGLTVIEDGAQGLCATWQGRALGTFGALAALSFHATKNVVAGEGGALMVNDPSLVRRAHIVREKGTNRTAFMSGEVAKYTWYDVGSSYLPADYVSAVLLAQLENAQKITELRLEAWSRYHSALEPLERAGLLRRPMVPDQASHNGHLYYILVEDECTRERLRTRLSADGIEAPFHYVPLHLSPAGRKYGRSSGGLLVTEDLASRLLRLPLYPHLGAETQHRIVHRVGELLRS